MVQNWIQASVSILHHNHTYLYFLSLNYNKATNLVFYCIKICITAYSATDM